MKTDFKKVANSSTKVEILSVVLFQEGCSNYQYLVLEDTNNEPVLVDLQDGQIMDGNPTSFRQSDIQEFLRDEVARDGEIIRIIDTVNVKISEI